MTNIPGHKKTVAPNNRWVNQKDLEPLFRSRSLPTLPPRRHPVHTDSKRTKVPFEMSDERVNEQRYA